MIQQPKYHHQYLIPFPCVCFLWCWFNPQILPSQYPQFSSVQFSSLSRSCPTLCDLMNHSPPGLPVHHKLLEFTQTHARRVGDAIQPSHPLSSPSPPVPSPSQHQGLFQVNSSHEVAEVLESQYPSNFKCTHLVSKEVRTFKTS